MEKGKRNEQIKKDYASSEFTIHDLAEKYDLSRRMIQFILFPERLERNRALFKAIQEKNPEKYKQKRREAYLKNKEDNT